MARTSDTQHPRAAPAFRCLPDRVGGTRSLGQSLALAADGPRARYHDNDSPGIPRRFLRTYASPTSALLRLSLRRFRASAPLSGSRILNSRWAWHSASCSRMDFSAKRPTYCRIALRKASGVSRHASTWQPRCCRYSRKPSAPVFASR